MHSTIIAPTFNNVNMVKIKYFNTPSDAAMITRYQDEAHYAKSLSLPCNDSRVLIKTIIQRYTADAQSILFLKKHYNSLWMNCVMVRIMSTRRLPPTTIRSSGAVGRV
jgi:hypothetical protein